MTLVRAISLGILSACTVVLPSGCKESKKENNSCIQLESKNNQVLEPQQPSISQIIDIEKTWDENKILEIKNYIQQNKSQPIDILSKAIDEHDIMLIGDIHDQLWIERLVKESLLELKNKGLTSVVLEIHSKHQKFIDNLDYSKVDVKDTLIKKIYQGDELRFVPKFDVLIEAKKLGLNVICVDNYNTEYLLPLPTSRNFRLELEKQALSGMNYRELQIFNELKSNLTNNSKVLIFYGTAHVSKSPYMKGGGKYLTLGKYISDHFGIKKVVSFRSLHNEMHCNQPISSYENKLPKLKQILLIKEPIIIPDNRLLSFDDPKITGTDYVIIGND